MNTKYCYKFKQVADNDENKNRDELMKTNFKSTPCDRTEKHGCINMWSMDNIKDKSNLTEIVYNTPLKLKGCWVGHDFEKDFCEYKEPPKNVLICYCLGNNCNYNNRPNETMVQKVNFETLEKPLGTHSNSSNHSSMFIAIYILSLLLVLSPILYYFYKQRNKLKEKFDCFNQSINAFKVKQSHNNNCMVETREPLLYKPKITKLEHIKQGQYGDVFRGKIGKETGDEQLQLFHPGQQILDLEQFVAIKIYPRHLHESFKHEYNVYNLPHIKHKNILKFICSEENQIDLNTFEYWLVLDYQENGSLYDYLKQNVISYNQLFDICLDIATGLSHLHNLNNDCVVVHRDIKSKNILLKADLTACISDFNLALILYPNQSNTETLGQVGTVRYMSPEVLDCAIQFSRDGFMRIDIYSMSLVFWEVLSRCSSRLGPVEPYMMPYEKELGTFLIKEQLRKHVVENKKRPEIPDDWCEHSSLKDLAEAINECWDHDPEARLTASGIALRLMAIKNKKS